MFQFLKSIKRKVIPKRIIWAIILVLSVGACAPDFDDLYPRGIIITSPEDQATVADSVTVEVFIQDFGGIDKVVLLVDKIEVDIESQTDPYTLRWDTKSVSDGAHQLSVNMFDGDEPVETSPTLNVTVQNELSWNMYPYPADIIGFGQPAVTPDGVVWMAGYDGQIHRLDENGWSSFPVIDPSEGDYRTAGEGSLVAVGESILGVYTSGFSTSLASGDYHTTFQFVHINQGRSRLWKMSFKSIWWPRHPDDISMGRDGSIWVITHNSIVIKFTSTQVNTWSPGPTKDAWTDSTNMYWGDDGVTYLATDQNEDTWIVGNGSGRGIWISNDHFGSWNSYAAPLNEWVYEFEIAPDGTKWFALYREGLLSESPGGVWKHHPNFEVEVPDSVGTKIVTISEIWDIGTL